LSQLAIIVFDPFRAMFLLMPKSQALSPYKITALTTFYGNIKKNTRANGRQNKQITN